MKSRHNKQAAALEAIKRYHNAILANETNKNNGEEPNTLAHYAILDVFDGAVDNGWDIQFSIKNFLEALAENPEFAMILKEKMCGMHYKCFVAFLRGTADFINKVEQDEVSKTTLVYEETLMGGWHKDDDYEEIINKYTEVAEEQEAINKIRQKRNLTKVA